MPRLALATLASLMTGCAAGALPPSRTDIATTIVAGEGGTATGYRFSTGAHLASGTIRRDIPIDVGAGYIYERVERPVRSPAVPLGDPVDRSSAETADAHGGYVEIAHLLGHGRAHRSWLGVRGEILARPTDAGRRAALGAHARLAWELYATGRGGGSGSTTCGVGVGYGHGTTAIGVFIESGAERTEDEKTVFVATAGLSVRLPFLAGFVIDLCPRC